MQEQQNTKLVVGIIGATVLLFAGLVFAVMNAPASSPVSTGTQTEDVTFRADALSPSIGKQDSAVVVRMYSDFQCPACRAVEPAVKHAIDTFKDRVAFVWKDFPLETIHPFARAGANAARCAEVQGKFWEYHDILFSSQNEWTSTKDQKPLFLRYANTLGLNIETFQTCLANKSQDASVAAGIAEGFANRVDRTPTVFINQKRYYGLTAAEWDTLLNQALAETNVATPTTTSAATGL